MSQENVEVVALAASGRLHVWHPDAEIIAFGPSPFAKAYRRGLQGVRDWYRDVTEDLSDASVSVEDLVAVGEELVVGAIRLTGLAKKSGVPFELVFGEVWTVRGGRIIRAQGYRDRAEALEAAGLRE